MFGRAAKHFGGRKNGFDVFGDAGDHATAAQRDQRRINALALSAQLYADGSLTADDMGIVIGGNVDQPVLLRVGTGIFLGDNAIVTVKTQVRAITPDGLYLGWRRVLRHKYDAWHGESMQSESDGKAMIAGRGRHYSSRPLLFWQREQRIHGSPHLERAGILEILHLQEDTRPR